MTPYHKTDDVRLHCPWIGQHSLLEDTDVIACIDPRRVRNMHMPVAFSSANSRRPRLQRRLLSPHQWTWSCGPLRSVNVAALVLHQSRLYHPHSFRIEEERRRGTTTVSVIDLRMSDGFRSARLTECLRAQGNVCSPVSNEGHSDDERS